MAQIINLRTRRKQTAREAARAESAVQSARHGVSKAESALTRARAEKAERELDAHQRAPESPQNS